MEIHDIAKHYATLPQVGALRHALENKSAGDVFLHGLAGSATALAFAALGSKRTFLLILNDADEAGYCYHDLTQLMKADSVMFFPSSYRRAVKYGQRDAPTKSCARKCWQS